jgi:hypothetical protein
MLAMQTVPGTSESTMIIIPNNPQGYAPSASYGYRMPILSKVDIIRKDYHTISQYPTDYNPNIVIALSSTKCDFDTFIASNRFLSVSTYILIL